jgi:four helix bundle protein
MGKTNFEGLRVYQLAEKLADRIWRIVINWDYFAKTTVGQQIVDAADGVGANIAEGTGRGVFRTIAGLSKLHAAHCMRLNTGCAERISGNC